MNPLSILRHQPTDALSIAKIASFLIAGATAVLSAARFAVPYFMHAFYATFPSLWTAVRVWLVPPYLFITVHIIIAAIWKLSDLKLHRNTPDKNPYPVKPVDLPKKDVRSVKKLDLSVVGGIAPEKSASNEAAVESPNAASKSAESCVTSELDENLPVSSRFEVDKSEEEEELNLEDTWDTIVMKKSATWERSSVEAAVAADVAGDRVVKRSVTFNDSASAATAPAVTDGTDEWNRRFEAFIKKNYDQIRSY